ncbi:hypothetical protein CASFOL_002695 [Castilleja foliolosa]|uniref:Uncharacterized protein n=1 Tax=Castilleja foliolosa TaxID=1961234 RepID=A0ABD3EIZ0_9LAMI
MAKMRVLSLLGVLLLVSSCLAKARAVPAEKHDEEQQKLLTEEKRAKTVTSGRLKDHRTCPLPDFNGDCYESP